jgi:hypothetical protein
VTRAKISQYSATANDNTDVNGVNIAEGCPPSSMNNMGREIMAALKRFETGADGDSLTVGGSLVVAGDITVNSQGDVRFADSDSSNYVALQAPATVASNVTFTLPAADGTSGQVIQTNGSGTLSFATPSSLTGETNSATPFETSLGSGAGAVNTGVNNTFIGFEAGNDNTTGTNNTALGYQALDANTTGVQNVAVGSGALGANTTGGYAVAIGYEALKANQTGDGNVAIGRQALLSNTTGIYNIAIGSNSLPANTSGSENIAIGLQTLRLNTTGGKNVAIGGQTAGNTTAAMDQNETGTNNVAVGAGALRGNTTASYNNAIGVNALYANTTGQFNVALGFDALASNTTASNNTGIGRDALKANTTGANNVAVGYQALDANTTGIENTAVGMESATAITTGQANAAFGYRTLFSCTTGSNNCAIGRRSLPNLTTGSGNVAIGDDSAYGPVFNVTTENTRGLFGHDGITNAYVKVAWTVTSDARDKTSIESISHGLLFVQQLNPVSYRWKTNREDDTPVGNRRYGFLAQEVMALEGDNPVIIDNEQPDHLKYQGEALVPVLVNAIKELSAKVEALEAQLKGN